MEISMRPASGLGTAELMLLEPESLLQSLNMKFKINSKPVMLEGVDWAGLMTDLAEIGDPGRVFGQLEGMEGDDSAAEGDTSSNLLSGLPRGLNAHPKTKQYRETPPSELSKYVGARVRIFTYFGNDVEGRLIQADREGVRVLQRLEQGMAEYPLEYGRIQQAEVWR